MKLELKNFSKIKAASIDFNGITVIAGDNNTGKSTIGKVLYTLFHGLCKIEDKVKYERPRETIQKIAESIYAKQEGRRRYPFGSLQRTILYFERAMAREDVFDFDAWAKSVATYVQQYSTQEMISAEVLKDIQEILEEMKAVSAEQIEQELLDSIFSDIFSQQVNSLLADKGKADILLTLQNKISEFSFEEDHCCRYCRNIDVLSDAIYIDDPFIVDSLSTAVVLRTNNYANRHLHRVLSLRNRSERVVANIIAQKKLDKIYEKLQTVVPGKIIMDSMESYLRSPKFKGDVKLANLSAGVKAFVILKMLLENAILQERGVLILDEPEIHLHPEWQMIYAELIVLLQKEFSLTILLTTHSPFFLDAIEVYSYLHGIKERLKCYLSSMDDEGAVFNDVTHQIDRVYSALGAPMQKMEDIRERLDMVDE